VEYLEMRKQTEEGVREDSHVAYHQKKKDDQVNKKTTSINAR
jgi:hypothetical protein